MRFEEDGRTKPVRASGFLRVGGALLAVGLLTVALVPLLARPALPSLVTERVSAPHGTDEGDGESNSAAVSSDGRYVAYRSLAANLVSGDSNGVADVFVKDRQSGAVTRVSVSGDGSQADKESRSPSISGAGQKVVFASDATNLVEVDTNGLADVFLRDISGGATIRVSVPAGAAEPDGESYAPVISNDGRYVAFASRASNLLPGDGNNEPDVFVKDLSTGILERISAGPAGEDANGGSEAPALSADGRYVAFASTASNLVDPAVGTDTNGVWDIYVYDRSTGAAVRASISNAGLEGDGHSFAPAVSADGALVAFASYAATLVPGDTNEHVDIFLRHLTGGTTVLVSTLPSRQLNGDSFHPCISGDGYHIAFDTLATDADADTADGKSGVFLCDLGSGTLIRCSVATDGSSANDSSARPALSLDGRWVAFSSGAWNLLSIDTNSAEDVFLRGPLQ